MNGQRLYVVDLTKKSYSKFFNNEFVYIGVGI